MAIILELDFLVLHTINSRKMNLFAAGCFRLSFVVCRLFLLNGSEVEQDVCRFNLG